MRQTSNSFRVCGSMPFAASSTITTLSTASERAVGVFAEVLVARRVEQRDVVPVELELERGRADRDAALLLHLHPVGDGVALRLAAADGAGQLDRAGVEQQLLGQRGLAGVGVGNDGERPPPGDFARQACRRRRTRSPLR